MKYLHFILAILLVLVILFTIIYYRSKPLYNIPPIIWTYWNNDTIPEVVQKCIDSWHNHNPTYRVIVLSPKNLMDYININVKDISFNDSSARESDIVRLLVLEKYGGIWSDATIFLTQPYPFSLTSYHPFIGYYIDSFTTDKDYPVLESWFFATVPNGEFITKWREAFFKLEEYNSVEEAIESVKARGIDLQNISNPTYLYIHVAAQSVMQTSNVTKSMKFMKAEDGPYKYITTNEWNSVKALEDLCKGNHRTDINKFRGAERGILMDRKDLQDCILGP